MNSIEFTVAGRPAGMGSGRAIPVKRPDGAGGHRMGMAVTVASKRTRPFQAAVAMSAADTYHGELLRGPMAVDLHFYFARPAGHYGRGRNASALRPSAPVSPDNRSSGDVDKLCRAVLDALEGVIYADDAQVVDLRALKHYGAPEGVHIIVTALRAAAAA